MRILLAVLSIVSLALFGAAPGLAASSGTAEGVNPAASALFENATRILTVGGDIFLGDKITTGPNGQVQIRFDDNTELVVGPNSALLIEDYLIRNDGSAGKLVVDMLGGSFRFATGTAPKDDYLIKTPTGTIGVRGTAFDVNVDEDGIAHVIMYEGTGIICNTAANICEELSNLCELGEIGGNDASVLGNAQDTTGDDRTATKQLFPYAMSQAPLLQDFRLPHAYECLHKPPQINTPQSLLSGSGGSCGNFQDLGDGYWGPNECGECPPDMYYTEGSCSWVD